MTTMPRLPVRRALLSVSDKSGLVELAAALAAAGCELVSTGGTAWLLREAGHAVAEVADVTGSPEILGGRVKTLHPRVHAAILARPGSGEDQDVLAAEGITPFDLVVVNLYPFEAAAARGAPLDACVEAIDVGGPAMIRAAAKNHARVAVVTDPRDYPALIGWLRDGGTTAGDRLVLARKAFVRTAAYDFAIARRFGGIEDEALPEELIFAAHRQRALRYGENPHQRAALYTLGSDDLGVAGAQAVGGKPLSYNNLVDAQAALELVAEFDEPACAIVKHANPCGAAVGPSPLETYRRALRCDETSAFGGVVALNRPLDAEVAAAVTTIFTEVVVAPAADADARALFATKPGLRLLLTNGLPDPGRRGIEVRSLAGALLAQERDAARLRASDLETVTARRPAEAEARDLLFAWAVVKHVRSNAVVLARDGATVGIGMGLPSRVGSVEHALRALSARDDRDRPFVMASEAFFPFPDALALAARAGCRAVVQPGGSRNDGAVIEAANAADVAMVFTGVRHFRH